MNKKVVKKSTLSEKIVCFFYGSCIRFNKVDKQIISEFLRDLANNTYAFTMGVMDQSLVKMNGGYRLIIYLMLILVELYKTFTNN